MRSTIISVDFTWVFLQVAGGGTSVAAGDRPLGPDIVSHALAVSDGEITVQVEHLLPAEFTLLCRSNGKNVELELISVERSLSEGTATVTAL